jgi:hypothetical protein
MSYKRGLKNSLSIGHEHWAAGASKLSEWIQVAASGKNSNGDTKEEDHTLGSAKRCCMGMTSLLL